ncbi:VWA domain-containing protein [Corynebacterium sp. P5875]|uniref:VWA domain-containing protein n=1 Tax=Corynebacterium antarcticum TaxID=2800405 RepID=A0A9Q4CB48_9CORY|nr:VWA domain-containing protein [Corynebacterium antarcticum]MCX7537569.1 VWA domain-containing protein [Corynebacterium antarcticum]
MTAQPQDQIAKPQDQVLPVYIACDTSYSMSGEAIKELNNGLQKLVEKAQEEVAFGKELRLSIISFNSQADLIMPLQRVEPKTTVDPLVAQGVTRYDLALELISERIIADYQKIKEAHAKPVRPVVFFFTDGAPTDSQGHIINDMSSWKKKLEKIEGHPILAPRIYAFGFGQANEKVLQELTRTRDVTPNSDRVVFGKGEEVAEIVAGLFVLLYRTIIDAGKVIGSTIDSTMNVRQRDVDNAVGKVLDENIKKPSNSDPFEEWDNW